MAGHKSVETPGKPPTPRILVETSQRPPLGAAFHRDVNRIIIGDIEYEDPFKKIKLFDITGVESKPLTLDRVPADYRPYEGCLFDVLSEPDSDVRLEKLKHFFAVLASEGDPGRECGLLYTIMHIWKITYLLAMAEASRQGIIAVFNYFMDAGMFKALNRILRYCFNPKFLVKEYNRYVPYRILESLFAATQYDLEKNNAIVEKIIEDPEDSYGIFDYFIRGGMSCMEQIACAQVIGNISCYPSGVEWLLQHPKMVGALSMHLWCSYDSLYVHFRQYEDRNLYYHKHMVYTEIPLDDNDEENTYKPTPVRLADLTTFVALCAVCNVCAANPEEPMERIEPCLLEVVKEGYFHHLGAICHGIILNDSKFTELSLEKFLSFTSWCCFQEESQKIILEQLRMLPGSRLDNPFCFKRRSYTKTCSVLACLVTHSLWLDYEKGSHFAILGIVSLLRENDEVAMEVIKVANDMLFDLAHSPHFVKMPGIDDPISVKRCIMTAMLKYGGSRYYTEQGDESEIIEKKFEDPPQCVKDTREFCERHMREQLMSQYEKENRVSIAEAFKSEGNICFVKEEFEAAIECYTKALEYCPLTCTERRVTYYSNRAECYLKTDHSRKALRDCNKALAQNPNNLRARWRRALALQNCDMKYSSALDLLTIKRHEEEAKQILGEKFYSNLNIIIYNLMDGSTYLNLTSEKNGPTVYQGMIARNYAENIDSMQDKSKAPCFQGKYYHDIFGIGHSKY